MEKKKQTKIMLKRRKGKTKVKKKLKKKERKMKKMKKNENERMKKNSKKKNLQRFHRFWFHTKNPQRFPRFAIVVVAFIDEIFDDFQEFVAILAQAISLKRHVA